MKTNRLTALVAGLVCLGFTGGAPAQLAQEPKNLKELQKDPRAQEPRQGYQGRRSYEVARISHTPPRYNKASTLIGMKVQNDQGEKLGTVKDIVIDLEKQRVSYVVLSSGGAFGVGDKLLAVPMAAFTRSAERDDLLMLGATKESIAQARGIGPDWPSVQEPAFGAEPFWREPSDQPSYERPETDQQTPPQP